MRARERRLRPRSGWRRAHSGEDDRGRERSKVSPSGDRGHRPLRRPRGVVLGLADRGAPLRRRRGRSRRRRQFGGPGRGVSFRSRRQGADDGPRPGSRRKHVALPHRSHRRHLEHRADDRDRDRRSERLLRRSPRNGALARPARRAGVRGADPQRLSVRRRRSGDRMAARLRRDAGQGGLRGHRHAAERRRP